VFFNIDEDSMNTHPESQVPPNGRRSIFKRKPLIAFLAGVALTGGVAALAAGHDACGWHPAMMTDGTPSAADVSAHIDHVLKHLYVEIDATDAQKAQIGPLVKQAVNDLLPLHAQLQASRAQFITGLTQSTVDRTALEAARTTHLQLADQASKRIVQLIADVGDVLTPEQRNELAAQLKKMHGRQGT
jgi:Spy/CpxP family protein refolding chaperone